MKMLFVVCAAMLMGPLAARAAEPPGLAVFDFEMIDNSLDGEMRGKRADE